MCSELKPNSLMICDVAINDVTEQLDGFEIVLRHKEGQGTIVEATGDYDLNEFRAQVNRAIANHGGSLPQKPSSRMSGMALGLRLTFSAGSSEQAL